MTTEELEDRMLEAARATLARRNPGRWIPPKRELAAAFGAALLTGRQLVGEQTGDDDRPEMSP